MKVLSERKHQIKLFDGRALQFHPPFRPSEALDLKQYLPTDFKGKVEVEIGCGKGEFLAARAQQHPERFLIGIDRRSDRFKKTSHKMRFYENWKLLKVDALAFTSGIELPPLHTLHVYHPDPWPKARHHKHRFFRSPDAKKWSDSLVPGGELRISTDHREYFFEILDIVKSWNTFDLQVFWQKEASMAPAHSYFENIFLSKNEAVYKAIYSKR